MWWPGEAIVMIKIAAMVGTPDLRQETLAVYAGDLDTAFNRLGNLGYDGVELMVPRPGSAGCREHPSQPGC